MIEEKKVSSEETVLIGVVTQHQDEEESNEYLDELEFLTLTAGGVAVKRFTQKLEKPKSKELQNKALSKESQLIKKYGDMDSYLSQTKIECKFATAYNRF